MPLPAKNYLSFIDLFERKVAEAQKEIKLMDRLMRPYEIVRRALDESRLSNAVKLDMAGNRITANLTILPGDRLANFRPLLEAINIGLVNAKLRQAEEPRYQQSLWYWRAVWRLTAFDPYVQVNLELEAPYDGTDLIECRTAYHTVERTEAEHVVIWHDKPFTSSPPVPPIPPAVKLDDEIPF